MNDSPKSKSNIILKILYIVAPLLTVFAAVVLIYAWYTNTLQTGELDVTTKNFTIEYTFDEDTEVNVLEYTIDDIAFFDYDAEEEIIFLDGEAKPLEIHLKNTSESDLNYTVTFKATKTILTDNNTIQSVAYIGALLDVEDLSDTSIEEIYSADTTNTNYTGAAYDATSADTIAATNYLEVKQTGLIQAGQTDDLVLYLFGIQEIDNAINSQFLYTTDENDNVVLRQYTFEIKIYAEPISSAEVEEK